MVAARGLRGGDHEGKLIKGYTLPVIIWIISEDPMYNMETKIDNTVLYT